MILPSYWSERNKSRNNPFLKTLFKINQNGLCGGKSDKANQAKDETQARWALISSPEHLQLSVQIITSKGRNVNRKQPSSKMSRAYYVLANLSKWQKKLFLNHERTNEKRHAHFANSFLNLGHGIARICNYPMASKNLFLNSCCPSPFLLQIAGRCFSRL